MRNLIEIINWYFIYETCAHFILVHEELERNNCNYCSRFYLCIHYDKRIPQNVRERWRLDRQNCKRSVLCKVLGIKKIYYSYNLIIHSSRLEAILPMIDLDDT